MRVLLPGLVACLLAYPVIASDPDTDARAALALAGAKTAQAPRPAQVPKRPDPFALANRTAPKVKCACKPGDCYCCEGCSCGGHKIKGKTRTPSKKAMKKKINDRPVRYFHQPFRFGQSC